MDVNSEQQVRAQEKMPKLRRKLKEAKHQHKQLKQGYIQIKVELQSHASRTEKYVSSIANDLDRLVEELRVK